MQQRGHHRGATAPRNYIQRTGISVILTSLDSGVPVRLQPQGFA